MTDKQLLERISQKDEEAFRMLYDRYRRLFFGWVLSRLNDEDASCDLTQEFWISVWTAPEKIQCDDTGSAKNWLLRHISFGIMDYIRIQCKRLEITDEMLIEQKIRVMAYTHVQEDINFLELQQLIDDILHNLPPLIQKVYELRCVRNFSAKETAKVLGIAESTVYNNLSSALICLRNELTLQYTTNDSGKLKILLPILLLLLN